MKDLNLYANRINLLVLPTQSRFVANLVVLNVGYNDISFLPKDLCNFKNLKSLNIESNFISEIPSFIGDMLLNTVKLSNNPIADPPMEVAERGLNSMRRYWQCRRGRGTN